ncbi:MAG: glycosyltransferase family 4 protein [Flavobacteriales bacterium]
MKIAVVTAHYLPEMGYLEVDLARGLHKEGNEVRVFTSTHIPPRARGKGVSPRSKGLKKEQRVEVLRLSHRSAHNQVVIAKGLRKAVETYDPDLTIAIGIGKIFPGPVLLPPEERRSRLIGLFGNTRFNYRNRSLQSFQKRFVQRLLKDRQYQKAVRHCDSLWCYTPETQHILRSFIGKREEKVLQEKLRLTSLGFDPECYYFDPEEREGTRRAMGMETDGILFVTATRPVPSKKLEELIEAFEGLMEAHGKVHYLLVGASEDAYSARLEKRMASSSKKERLHMLPFQGREELRRSFNAADIGVWTAASISIQQGMGTGLPVLLPNAQALSHLIDQGKNGVYFEERALLEGLRQVLQKFGNGSIEARKERAEENAECRSDRAIARDLLERSMGEC